MLKAKTHIVEFICDGKGIRWKRKTQIREIPQQPLLEFGVWRFFRFFLRQGRCRRSRAVTPDCGTLCTASAIWPRGDNTDFPHQIVFVFLLFISNHIQLSSLTANYWSWSNWLLKRKLSNLSENWLLLSFINLKNCAYNSFLSEFSENEQETVLITN